MGAPAARAWTVTIAFANGSANALCGDDVDTGLTRSRVASRSASASPKNSLHATRKPVTAANRRTRSSGNPIHLCDLRKDAVFMMPKCIRVRAGGEIPEVSSVFRLGVERPFQGRVDLP